MAEEKKYEDGYPAMRYRPSSDPRGYEHVTVHSSAEERALGDGWHNNPGHCLPGAEVCSCKKHEAAPAKGAIMKQGRPSKPKDSASA